MVDLARLISLLILLLPPSLSLGTRSCPPAPLLTPRKSTCSAVGQVEKAYTGGGHVPSQTSAWDGPHDCHGDICIFSHRALSKHEWAILATTPDDLARLRTAAASDAQHPATTRALSPSPAPYTVADVPGKGRGLVATRAIRAGEVVLAEDAVFIVHAAAALGGGLDMSAAATDEDEDEHESGLVVYDMILENLPRSARAEFMAQVGDDVRTIMHRNGFAIPPPPGAFPHPHEQHEQSSAAAPHVGSFPQQALINHDCRPNLAYRFHGFTHIATAVRAIAAGEELTNSYIDATLPHAARQAQLLARFHFACTCTQCAPSTAPAATSSSAHSAPGLSDSDARLARIAALHDAMDHPAASFPAGALTAAAGAELVALYRQERLDVYMGLAYRRAALNYALFGREGPARRYAARALPALERMVSSGPALDEDLGNMRALVAAPRDHWSWGRLVVPGMEVEQEALG